MKLHRIVVASFLVAGLLASTSPGWANNVKGNGIRLPGPVEKTFKATFPKAEITKVEVDRENGVSVYGFEFNNQGLQMEADIAADGTLTEFTVVIEAKDVPAAVLNTIQRSATGGTIKRFEHVEVVCETKDGKVIKLPKPMTQYIAGIAKGKKQAEIVVAPDGTVVEPAWWDAPEGTGEKEPATEKQVQDKKSSK
jgi:hypothetical protein